MLAPAIQTIASQRSMSDSRIRHEGSSTWASHLMLAWIGSRRPLPPAIGPAEFQSAGRLAYGNRRDAIRLPVQPVALVPFPVGPVGAISDSDFDSSVLR